MSEFQREARFFAELPVMPLREVVMLPRTIMPLFVGREASIKAIELAQSGYNKQMFLVAQREPDVEKPGADDLSPVGVVCKVLQMLRLPDGTIVAIDEEKGAYVIHFDELATNRSIAFRVKLQKIG